MRRGSHQHHLEAALFQHPEQRYPVHAGGLHDHRFHPALTQPVRQAVQVRGESLKFLHRWLRPVGGHRHEMAAGPHVDARPRSGLPGTVPLAEASRPNVAFSTGFALLRFGVIVPLQHRSVGASPEGATDCSQSPERDHPNGTSPMMPPQDSQTMLCAGQPAPMSSRPRSGTTRLVGRLTRVLRLRQLVSSARPEPGHNVALRQKQPAALLPVGFGQMRQPRLGGDVRVRSGRHSLRYVGVVIPQGGAALRVGHCRLGVSVPNPLSGGSDGGDATQRTSFGSVRRRASE